MNFRRSLFVFLITILGLSADCFSTDSVRIEINRDAWISAYPGEQDGNNGAAPRLKLKGIQEFFLFDFDASPYRGKKIQRAELRIKSANEDPALRVTVSTVTTQWQEGNGNSYSKESEGCSFLWAVAGKERWTKDGGDITDVTLGNGGSIWSFGDASPKDSDGWQRIPIEPALLQSKLDGHSFGFLVMDDVGSEYRRDGNRFEYRLMPNRFFYSRDQNRASAPYLMVWFDEPGLDSRSVQRTLTMDESESLLTHKVQAVSSKLKRAEEHFAQILKATRDVTRNQTISSNELAIKKLDGSLMRESTTGLAKGESISWIIDEEPENLQIDAPDFFLIHKFALPRIEGKLDPAVPIQHWEPETLGLPTNTSVATAFDIYATKSMPPGDYKVVVKGASKSVTKTIRVWGFSLPDELSFIPQMNCYGLPSNERTYYQLCHDHRTTLNSLRYGWTGKVASDAVPKRKPDGSLDWREWDEKWGPLFDGSAFSNSKRGAVPIEAFYLPINENWPMNHEKHFRGGYWIENAYGDEYWQEFRDIVQDFSKHLEEKSYRDTLFEFYLNNKVYFKEQRGGRWDGCSAPWVFDEPVNTQDFWALRRFGIEFWKGIENAKGPRFGFRVDISRPQWQRDLLDGVSSVEVVSGALRQYQDRVIDRADQFHNLVYMYGAANTLEQSCNTNIAWCVETWARGGNGVVPWQTMGTKESWAKLDPLAVIYPTDFGASASLRLKSFRDGQQLVEYLEAFRIAHELSQREMGTIVLKEFGLAGQTLKRNEEDAGSVRFDAQTLDQLNALRWALGESLHQAGAFATGSSPMLRVRNKLQIQSLRDPVKLSVDE